MVEQCNSHRLLNSFYILVNYFSLLPYNLLDKSVHISYWIDINHLHMLCNFMIELYTIYI